MYYNYAKKKNYKLWFDLKNFFFLAKFDSAINLNHICCKYVCVSRYVVKLNVSVKNEKCSVKALHGYVE